MADDTWTGTALNIRGHRIALLPDAHLGRRFVADVPLHRRGEREAMVMQDFANRMYALAQDPPTFHVCVGDLFDKPYVDPGVVLETASLYRSVAKACPETTFVVIAGNHDLSKDVAAKTSFDLFAAIVGNEVSIVRDEPRVLLDGQTGLRLGFVPWSPSRSAAEMVKDLPELDCVFGHWDVVAPGEDKSNLAPIERIRETVSIAVTGHDHRCRIEDFAGFKLYVTGSMQPYSHSEDQTGALYRTVTLEELAAISKEELRKLCVRVLLKPDDEAPNDIDALQVRMMRAASTNEEHLQVGFGEGLDMKDLFETVFNEFEVPVALRTRIMEKYRSC